MLGSHRFFRVWTLVYPFKKTTKKKDNNGEEEEQKEKEHNEKEEDKRRTKRWPNKGMEKKDCLGLNRNYDWGILLSFWRDNGGGNFFLPTSKCYLFTFLKNISYLFFG